MLFNLTLIPEENKNSTGIFVLGLWQRWSTRRSENKFGQFSSLKYICRMKTCTMCKMDKPLDEFAVRDKTTGRRHSCCKSCKRIIDNKAYKTQTTRRDKIRKNAVAQIQWLKLFVRRVKQRGQCSKCNEKRWYVLDFHHTSDDKEHTISLLVARGGSIKRLKNEMRKCILLCSNCHREHHYLEEKLTR